MFGVTHVVAADGYSHKMVGLITILPKNAILIHNLLFQPLLLTDELWNQICVDHGTEFVQVNTSQQCLSAFQQDKKINQPYYHSLTRIIGLKEFGLRSTRQ